MDSACPRVRLAAMMFGQYFVLGAWIVTLATFLMASPSRGGLAFPASHTAWVYSTLAIAGIVSPLFTGFLADRLFAAERLLGIFHLLGAVLLGCAALWCAQRQPIVLDAYRAAGESELVHGANPVTAESLLLAPESAEAAALGDPESVRLELGEALERVRHRPEVAGVVDETFGVLFVLMLLYSFCCLSTLTLSNVVGLRNLRDPQRSFGGVRLFGTAGWVAAGFCVGLLVRSVSPEPLYLAAGTGGLFGLYCFTLPHTPPKGQRGSLLENLGLPALRLFENGPFLVLIVCALGSAVTQQFYAIYANRYLNDLDAPYPTVVQTLAQIGEIASMALFPVLLPRLGSKGVLTLGLVGLVLRNVLFATQSPAVVVILGLPLHGVSYAFFSILAAMYVDRLAPPHLRASAQGIVTFITLGAGTLLGNWLSAQVVEHYTRGSAVAWGSVWVVPGAMAAAVAVAFVVLFRGADEPERTPA